MNNDQLDELAGLATICATVDPIGPGWYTYADLSKHMEPCDARLVEKLTATAVLELIAAARGRRNRDRVWPFCDLPATAGGCAVGLTPDDCELPAAPDASGPASQVGMSDSECAKTPPPNAGEGLRLRAALTLALDYLGELEPGDSRAVSNEYVAMAGVLCDIEPNRPGEEIEIILNALRARKNPNVDEIAQALRSNSPEAG